MITTKKNINTFSQFYCIVNVKRIPEFLTKKSKILFYLINIYFLNIVEY